MSALMPLPNELTHRVRGLLGMALSTTVLVASIPGRVLALLDQTEALIARIELVTVRADQLVTRATLTTVEAERVVANAALISATAQELIDLYAPLATKAAPLMERVVDEFGPGEVHAVAELISYLPELTTRMTAIMPILATLDTVAPEIHELLDVVKDVRQAIQGVPGFKFLRKRGESRELRVPAQE